jgi:hypothetical protein
MEVKDMHRLEAAFEHVGARTEPVEGFHAAVGVAMTTTRPCSASATRPACGR